MRKKKSITIILLLLVSKMFGQVQKDTLIFKNSLEKQTVIITSITNKKITYKAQEDSRLEHEIKTKKLEQVNFYDGVVKKYQPDQTILKRKYNLSASLSNTPGIENTGFLNLEYMYGKGLSAIAKVSLEKFFLGSKYYFFPESNSNFKVSSGLLLGFDGEGTHSGIITYPDGYSEIINLFVVRVPLDLTYQLKRGFNINFGISFNHGSSSNTKDNTSYSLTSTWGELEFGLGYRF